MSLIWKASCLGLGWMLLALPVALACHSNELSAPYKGHYHYGKGAGLLQLTEGSTVYTAVTTSCDFYTAFLEQEYEAIAQQAAQGQGAHLNVVATYAGCPVSSHAEFGLAMRDNYEQLFREQNTARSHELRQGVTEMIGDTPTLRQACNNN